VPSGRDVIRPPVRHALRVNSQRHEAHKGHEEDTSMTHSYSPIPSEHEEIVRRCIGAAIQAIVCLVPVSEN
jgi:hypothetical protein